jgi:hypothetical protein
MSDRLFVATRKGLFAVERTQGRWSVRDPSFLGDPVTAVLPDARDGMLYAALNLGHFGVKMRRSTDGGKTWDEHAVPTYPPQPENLPEGAPPWKLVQVWVLESGGASETGVLWAGTNPGGLFRSVDRGETWTLTSSPTFSGAVYGAAVVPRLPGYLVAGPKGLSWTRTDGRSWTGLSGSAYWAVDCISRHACWAVGPGGRITRVTFGP